MNTDDLRNTYGDKIHQCCKNDDECFTDDYVLWLENNLINTYNQMYDRSDDTVPNKKLADILAETGFNFDKLKNEDYQQADCLIKAIEQYREQESDKIFNLLTKPNRLLKPLEDLWRLENSPNRFVIPDATKFYRWIVSKIIK